MGKPVNQLRRVVLRAIEKRKPDHVCRCIAPWCDGHGVIKIGARWYCKGTGRVLSSPSAEALL